MPSELTVKLDDDGGVILTDEGPTVCLGIACNKYQAPAFWTPLIAPGGRVTHFTWSQHGLVEFKKSPFWTRHITTRGAGVDSNRNKMVSYFLYDTMCDYLLQIDDDVEIPHSIYAVTERLISHTYPIVGGIYFRGSEPYGPIVFLYDKGDPRDGYVAMIDWEPDSLLKVDAIGMGLSLIHREVFEKMEKEMVVVESWRGEVRLEHPDDLEEHLAPSDKILKREDMPDYQWFPWYCQAYQRTEDLYFCENAKRLGYDIWCDTSMEAEGHIQWKAIDRDDFVRARRKHEKEPTVWRAN